MFALVRNLAVVSGVIVLIQIAYAVHIGLGNSEIVTLALTALLAAIPIALPASFTLTSALAARALAREGVLPTRLSAVDEAASMDVLCADKTGTLTRNELAVSTVVPVAGQDKAVVLALAALASSDGGQDPVDAAIRTAASLLAVPAVPQFVRFLPFDPATRMAEAIGRGAAGSELRIVKGAYSTDCRDLATQR